MVQRVYWLVTQQTRALSRQSFLDFKTTTDIVRPTSAGSVPGSISGLKLVELSNGTFAMAFSGTAAPNGTLYNSALAEEPVSTGRMYTQIFVRHWDTCRFGFGSNFVFY